MHRRAFVTGAVGVAVSALTLSWSDTFGPETGQGRGHVLISCGREMVVLRLYHDTAPAHADRFASLARRGFYDGLPFHLAQAGFMAQFGDPRSVGRTAPGLSPLPAEISDRPFVKGSVGIARGRNPNSPGHQIFVTLADAPYLDRRHTMLGEVVAGLSTIAEAADRHAATDGRSRLMVERVRVADDIRV